jgi:hypothetical protein
VSRKKHLKFPVLDEKSRGISIFEGKAQDSISRILC